MRLICPKCEHSNKCSIWKANNALQVVCKNCGFIFDLYSISIITIRLAFVIGVTVLGLLFYFDYLKDIYSHTLLGLIITLFFGLLIYLAFMPIIALVICFIVNRVGTGSKR